MIYLNCVKEWKHQLVVLVCDMDQDDRSQGQSRQDQSCTWDTSCQSYWTTHGPSLTLFHFSWWYSDFVLLYYYLRLGLNCDTEAAWLRGSEAVQQYLMMSQPAVQCTYHTTHILFLPPPALWERLTGLSYWGEARKHAFINFQSLIFSHSSDLTSTL